MATKNCLSKTLNATSKEDLGDFENYAIPLFNEIQDKLDDLFTRVTALEKK
jgi:hypothetical protein